MPDATFSKSLCAIAVGACLLASPAFARGDAATPITPRLPAITADDAAEQALSARIESLLKMRLALAQRSAPGPSETDPVMMLRHLAAIDELSAFSEQTVLGLLAAAGDPDTRMRLAAALAPVVARHEQDLAATFAPLHQHPLGRDNSLLKRAEIADQASQRRVLDKLKDFAERRETRLDLLPPGSTD